MVVTKILVWARLPNLLLPYWNHQVLEGIGSYLGRFLKVDRERMDKDISTFARICVEMDLRKGLPDRIHLTHQDIKWRQWLDFENTTFRCHIFHQIGTCRTHGKKQRKGQRKDNKRKEDGNSLILLLQMMRMKKLMRHSKTERNKIHKVLKRREKRRRMIRTNRQRLSITQQWFQSMRINMRTRAKIKV